MTKADLIAIIADKLKFPWARAELLVDVVFDCMEQSMSRGEKIEIRATRPNYPYTQGCSAATTCCWTRCRPSSMPSGAASPAPAASCAPSARSRSGERR